jgi:hypothetical protein
MAITDIEISEELMTNAPSIKYSGDEGPKSPQEEQMMMADAILEEEYNKYVFDLLEIRPEATPMTLEEFRQMVIAEGQMSKGPILPSPEDPVNPFQPKPQGPVLPDRQMAAYGGIMGMDGRRQYGLGSFFQKYIKDPIEVAITGKTFDELEEASQKRVDSEPQGYEGVFDRLLKGEKKVKDGKEYREGGLDKYIIPAIGGITAGLFTKKNQDDSSGGQPTADETALMLADLKKSANILDQEQGLAAGLNFLPAVSARKFTPEQMIETYKASAANGGRIGYNQGNAVVDETTTQMILDMNKRGMDVDTISTMTQTDTNTVNAIISAQNQKSEGGIMDLGGMEKDYRNTGGFVDIGAKEKADDVPARLSVNEFVMTADAVRGMGNGDIDLGAKRMENLMGAMENKTGAQQMFDVSERLSEVV